MNRILCLTTNKIFVIFLIAFLVRLLLIIFTSQSLYEHNDSYLHRDWGRVSFLYGSADTYRKDHISNVGAVNNLPPGATYLFGGMYYFHVQASKVINTILDRPPGTLLWMNDGTFANMFLRLPAVIADLIIGAVIFLFVSKSKKMYALLASSLYLFNPASIYNSAVWGQIDSVPLMFFIIGLYLLSTKHYFLSILAVALSFFVKLSLLPLLPLYGIIIFLQVSKKKILAYSAAVYGIVLLLILPVSQTPQQWLFEFILKNSANVLDNVTANAYNFWWFILAPKLLVPAVTVGEKFLFASYSFWGYSLYGLFLVFLVVVTARKKDEERISPEFLLGLFSIISIIYFLFLPSMHERYLFTFFPFMAAYIGFKREYLKLYLAIIIVHTVNILSVWQYRVPEVDIRSNPLLTNQFFSWSLSLFMTVAGIYLYKRFISFYSRKQKSQ